MINVVLLIINYQLFIMSILFVGKGDAPKVTMYFENGDKSTQGQKSEPTEPMDEANINAAFDVDDEIFSQMEY